MSGAVLIAALTTSLIGGIQKNPAVPSEVKATAQTELASGVPFLSDKDLYTALSKADVPNATADEIVKENANARIDALRSSLSVVAVIALIALFTTLSIPTRQPTGRGTLRLAQHPPHRWERSEKFNHAFDHDRPPSTQSAVTATRRQ